MNTHELEPRGTVCEDARTQLSACFDGEAERTPNLEEHLRGCPACRAFETGLHGLSDRFAALRDAPLPGTSMERARWSHPAAGRRSSQWAVRAAAGLLGIASIAVPAAFFRQHAATRSASPPPFWLAPLTAGGTEASDRALHSWRTVLAREISGDSR